MATHSTIIAWKIPWTEETVWLQSIVLQRVRHNLVTKQIALVLVRDRQDVPYKSQLWHTKDTSFTSDFSKELYFLINKIKFQIPYEQLRIL